MSHTPECLLISSNSNKSWWRLAQMQRSSPPACSVMWGEAHLWGFKSPLVWGVWDVSVDTWTLGRKADTIVSQPRHQWSFVLGLILNLCMHIEAPWSISSRRKSKNAWEVCAAEQWNAFLSKPGCHRTKSSYLECLESRVSS